MTNEKLQVRYTGTSAEQYDAERRESPRFRAEEVAFSKYFGQISPSSVIDCPFGTGRWVDYYRNLDGPVIAVDLSDDMLAMAKQKIDATRTDIRFITGSAFEFNFSQFAVLRLDVLVCTRFLNWFNAPLARKAIANLSTARTQWAIVGASVRPSDFPLLKRLHMKVRLYTDNLRRRQDGVALEYVHDEQFILSAFSENGWEAIEKTHVFSNTTRENYFWLLKRKSA